MQKINITALRHSAFYTPLLFTISGGFLQKHGLEPNYQPAKAGQSINALLLSGDYHLSQSAPAVSFLSLEKQQPSTLLHFAQINQKDGFFISSRKPIDNFKWTDLEGSTMLIDHLFQPLATFKYACFKHAVDINKINIIDAGDVDAIDKSFRDGTADFVHQQGPAPQQLEAEGFAYVVANMAEAIGPIAFSSLCATKDWLNTDMAAAFQQAYQQACTALFETSSDVIMQRIKHFFPNTDEQVLSHTISHYKQLGCWNSDTKISDESYQNLLDVFEFNKLISKRYEKSEMII